jgi:CDGSH iron-sulfur domain-containing protein 3
MPDVVIRLRPNGPLLVEGPFELLDAEGNPILKPEKPVISFCRCGQSANKPFCDGHHRDCGFVG